MLLRGSFGKAPFFEGRPCEQPLCRWVQSHYGCLRKTNYRWLNLKVLFQNVLQAHNEIERITIFPPRLKIHRTILKSKQDKERILLHWQHCLK